MTLFISISSVFFPLTFVYTPIIDLSAYKPYQVNFGIETALKRKTCSLYPFNKHYGLAHFHKTFQDQVPSFERTNWIRVSCILFILRNITLIHGFLG